MIGKPVTVHAGNASPFREEFRVDRKFEGTSGNQGIQHPQSDRTRDPRILIRLSVLKAKLFGGREGLSVAHPAGKCILHAEMLQTKRAIQ